MSRKVLTDKKGMNQWEEKKRKERKSMYGKSYESKYEGSMVGAGLNVFAVWDYMTTKARNGYVEVNPILVAFTLGGAKQDVKEIEEALDFLQRPDGRSRSKLEGGRRIVKEGEYQYRLVNWEEYNRIRTEEERREYNRQMQRDWRERQKGKKLGQMRKNKPLVGEGVYVEAVGAGASEEELDQMVGGEGGEGSEKVGGG